MAYWSFVKLYTVVVHYLQMCMKEYGCCPKFKRGYNSTYTFTKRGGGMYLVNATPTIASGGVSLSEFTHSSSYFWVITILPFDHLYRRAYFVMHTFLVNTFFV